MELSEETTQILEGKYFHGKNEICWGLTDKEKISLTKRWEEEQLEDLSHKWSGRTACYSGVPAALKSTHTYMLTSMVLAENTTGLLSKEDMIWWLREAKKHGLLPSYTYPKRVVGKGKILTAAFDLKNIKVLSQLYVYLSIIRYIKEEPGLIKVVKHLVRDLKIGFFIAFAVGHVHAVHSNGHSLVPIRDVYPYNNKVVAGKAYDLHGTKALKRLMTFPEKYDVPKEKTNHWRLHNLLTKMQIEKLPKSISFQDVDSPEIQKLMNEDILET